MTDFNKPGMFSRLSDELLDTIKNNIASVGKFDASGMKNVPVGFIRIDTSDDNLRLYKHMGNNQYNLMFDYNQLFQSNLGNVSSNITMTGLSGKIPADFKYWVSNNFTIESINKSLPNSIYTAREGEINLDVHEPGWVNMIIVGPGGTAMKGDRTDRTGIYSVINNFTDIQANMKTTIEGDAFRYAFNEAGIAENHVITVPGFSGDDVQTEMPATFTKAQMQALKGLDVAFYRGARSYREKITQFLGGASGAVRLDPDIDLPPYDYSYPLYINRGFGQGMDLDPTYSIIYTQSDGGLISKEEYASQFGRKDPKAGDVGFGGGSSLYAPDNNDVYGGRGGGGAAMIKLRVYLNEGSLKIKISPADVIYRRCLNNQIKTNKYRYTQRYDPAKHGGLPGGRGVVIIEPIVWSTEIRDRFKNFNKPDLNTDLKRDFLDTVKSNIEQTSKMIVGDHQNSPLGYKDITVSNDALTVKENTVTGFKSVFDTTQKADDVLGQLVRTDDFIYPEINVYGISASRFADMYMSDSGYTVKKPGWVQIIMVGPRVPVFWKREIGLATFSGYQYYRNDSYTDGYDAWQRDFDRLCKAGEVQLSGSALPPEIRYLEVYSGGKGSAPSNPNSHSNYTLRYFKGYDASIHKQIYYYDKGHRSAYSPAKDGVSYAPGSFLPSYLLAQSPIRSVDQINIQRTGISGALPYTSKYEGEDRYPVGGESGDVMVLTVYLRKGELKFDRANSPTYNDWEALSKRSYNVKYTYSGTFFDTDLIVKRQLFYWTDHTFRSARAYIRSVLGPRIQN